jgi:GNAT superfamily N-acetyltransferase
MSHARLLMENSEWIVWDSPDPGRLVIRPFDPERDSIVLVDKLLRRASGLPAAVDSPVQGHARGNARSNARGHARRRQAAGEECFVAVCGGRIAGTITLQGPDPASACSHYRRPEVATLHHYGVDPALQRRGIGRALLSFANRWAAAHGYLQLALDMPVTAKPLLDFYHAQGFSLIDTTRFAGLDCDSAIFSRPTLPGWPCFHTSRTTHRSRGGGR